MLRQLTSYFKRNINHCCFNFLFEPPSLKMSFICFYFTKGKVFVFGVFLIRIFPHSDWMRRDASYLSVFSETAGKYGPEEFRIRTLFTQCLLSMYTLVTLKSLVLLKNFGEIHKIFEHFDYRSFRRWFGTCKKNC